LRAVGAAEADRVDDIAARHDRQRARPREDSACPPRARIAPALDLLVSGQIDEKGEALMPRRGRWIALLGLVAAALLQPALAESPKFQVDPTWPLTLPNNWIIGVIGGITVDAQDHIWINQRPSSLDAREKRASTAPNVKCCVPAPPVIEFDQAGKVVQGWGGDGPSYKWGDDGHGIYVDYNNFVWVGDNAETGGHIFKFTRDGKFVMRIGQPGTPTGSNDTAHLGRPADMVVDRDSNELFVADGYGNHRVIVFDATTGAYKRHWGAYGRLPTDEKIAWDPKGPPPQQFGNPVHCITITNDGLVLVCDRSHNRVQMFRKDGTFVREFSVLKDSAPGTIGSIAKWPDAAQTYLIVVDDPNGQFHVINRADGKLLDSFGRVGHQLGEFYNLHVIGIDSKGNIYTAEVQGKRLQKFRNLGGI
jgi:NHL repeat